MKLRNPRVETTIQDLARTFMTEEGTKSLNDNTRLILLTEAFNRCLGVKAGKEAVEVRKTPSPILPSPCQRLAGGTQSTSSVTARTFRVIQKIRVPRPLKFHPLIFYFVC